MDQSSFKNQPARSLLIDLKGPMDIDMCHLLQIAVRNITSIACSAAGPSRMPLFSIHALGIGPEVLLALQHVNGNFNRIQTALQRLQTVCEETYRVRDFNESSVQPGILKTMEAFQRHSACLQQDVLSRCLLEITLVTVRPVNVVTKEIEAVLKNCSLDFLKKIQVIQLLRKTDSVGLDTSTGLGSDNSQGSSQSSNSITPCLLDTIVTECDLLNIEQLLKSWLLDQSADRDQLHLVFQRLSTSNEQGPDDELVVYCDFQERTINTALLPEALQPQISSGHITLTKPPTSFKKSSSQPYIAHRLQLLRRVPLETICDSVVFGQPLILRYTSCWRMDWDELETNQKHFLALCHLLAENKEALVVKLQEHEGLSTSGHSRKKTFSNPTGIFVILPSGDSRTLLLRPVATSELLLPCDLSADVDVPNDESLYMTDMKSLIDIIPREDIFNPLHYRSGLYDNLVSMLTDPRKSQAKKQERSTTKSLSLKSNPTKTNSFYYGLNF